MHVPPSVWVTNPFHLIFSVAGHVFSQPCLWESPLDKELKIYRSVNAEALSTCLYDVLYDFVIRPHKDSYSHPFVRVSVE